MPEPRAGLPRRLLLGLDDDPGRGAAVDWAQALAKACRARLAVVSAHPPHAPLAAGLLAPRGAHAHEPTWSSAERARTLADLRAALVADGIDAETRVAEGAPAEVLVALAATLRSDLVVLGSHRHTLGERVLLGSVAERVLDASPCDVLVARAPSPPCRILLATDHGPASAGAHARAEALAATLDVELVVEHVAADLASYDAEARRLGASVAGPGRVRSVADVGEPGTEIVRRAWREDCGLIVVGARRLGRWQRATRSVSREVLRASRVSVLVAHAP